MSLYENVVDQDPILTQSYLEFKSGKKKDILINLTPKQETERIESIENIDQKSKLLSSTLKVVTSFPMSPKENLKNYGKTEVIIEGKEKRNIKTAEESKRRIHRTMQRVIEETSNIQQTQSVQQTPKRNNERKHNFRYSKCPSNKEIIVKENVRNLKLMKGGN